MSNSTYEKLDLHVPEIRLLFILPSDRPDSCINCELTHVDLDRGTLRDGKKQSFDAVSYVWGAPDYPIKIFLNGKSKLVTKNLFALLRQLRLPTQERVLWIDALCIDQGNKEEQNHQLRLMGAIYSRACHVLMWLGEEADDSSLGMDLLASIGDLLFRAKQGNFPHNEESKEMLKLFYDPSFDRKWKAVHHIFHRPYWTRVWIIQEILLSTVAVLFCGTKSLSWQSVYDLVILWDMHPGIFRSDAARHTLLNGSAVRSVAHLHGKLISDGPLTLFEGLLLSRQRVASRSQDHVLGIFGIVESAGLPLKLDYAKSTFTIYREVVKHMIGMTQSLDILTACKGLDLDDLRPSFERACSPDVSRRPEGILVRLKSSGITGLHHEGLVPIQSEDQIKTILVASPKRTGSKDDSDVEIQTLQTLLQNAAKLFGDHRRLWEQAERCVRAWPSWIPDWSLRLNDAPESLYLLSSQNGLSYFQAAGETQAKVQFLEDEDQLSIEGFYFDDVHCVFNQPFGVEDRAALADFNGWTCRTAWELYSRFFDDKNPYGDVDMRNKAFFGTLVLGKDEDTDGNSSLHSPLFKQFQRSLYADWKTTNDLNLVAGPNFIGVETASLMQDQPDSLNTSGRERIMYKYGYQAEKSKCSLNDIAHCLRYPSTLFITSRGYIGRGPLSMENGDQVCVLLGGKVPFVLRKEIDTDQYYLLGESYVHGIMGGEAVPDFGNNIQQFVLK
ncbi:heterokaryon incompatibility protein-domain-containing protein [Halenospora varia]|nr:heterokaryon incompatibility protein-domain-containing protein [Halenospora varia]